MSEFPAKFTGLMAGQNKAMIYYVASHTNPENYEFPYSNEVIDAIAAAGYKCISIEQLRMFQPVIDKYAAGEITKDKLMSSLPWHSYMKPEDRVKTLDKFADAVKYAKSKGVSFIASDDLGPYAAMLANIRIVPPGPEYQNVSLGNFRLFLEANSKDPNSNEISRIAAKLAGAKLDEIFKDKTLGITPDMRLRDPKFIAHFNEALNQERVGQNKEIIDYTYSRAKGGNVTFMYGYVHAAGGDMDELIEQKTGGTVAKILLVKDPAAFQTILENQKKNKITELPGVLIYTAYPTADGKTEPRVFFHSELENDYREITLNNPAQLNDYKQASANAQNHILEQLRSKQGNAK